MAAVLGHHRWEADESGECFVLYLLLLALFCLSSWEFGAPSVFLWQHVTECVQLESLCFRLVCHSDAPNNIFNIYHNVLYGIYYIHSSSGPYSTMMQSQTFCLRYVQNDNYALTWSTFFLPPIPRCSSFMMMLFWKYGFRLKWKRIL